MDKYDLLESFSGLDTDLLERSEQAGKPRGVKMWWAAAAACLVMAAAGAIAAPGIVGNRSAGIEPGQLANISEPGTDATAPAANDPQDTAPSISLDISPMTSPELVFNQVKGRTGPYAAPVAGFAIFSEELTGEELAAAAPDVLPHNVCSPFFDIQYWEVSGHAGYYGWGELEGVHLDFLNPEWGGTVTVTLRKPDVKVYSDVILETPEPVTSHLGPLECTAYRWQDDSGVLMWANFQIGGVAYIASVNVNPEDAEQAERDLDMVLNCYQGRALNGSAPDLDAYHMKVTHVWIDNSDLTLAQAREDETFGSYMPDSAPQGFTQSVIRRYKADNGDWLYGSWYDGNYGSFIWEVSYLDDYAASRITGVEDRDNYDLSLYSFPLGESVPAELRSIVDNPVFLMEELTLDTVCARACKVNEAGDTEGWRMNFSVLYGDVVVRVSAKGVSPEWVFEQLRKD